MPGKGGLNAAQMLSGELKAAILLNNEPEFDSAAGIAAVKSMGRCEMVVTLSPFKANMEFSDVMLPITPFMRHRELLSMRKDGCRVFTRLLSLGEKRVQPGKK